MSFLQGIHKSLSSADPLGRALTDKGKLDPIWQAIKPSTPPSPPGVPNPNDAANAAQSTTDSMRLRRGMLANIYAGAQNQAPVVGKTQLGT